METSNLSSTVYDVLSTAEAVKQANLELKQASEKLKNCEATAYIAVEALINLLKTTGTPDTFYERVNGNLIRVSVNSKLFEGTSYYLTYFVQTEQVTPESERKTRE